MVRTVKCNHHAETGFKSSSSTRVFHTYTLISRKAEKLTKIDEKRKIRPIKKFAFIYHLRAICIDINLTNTIINKF